jgi:hypothetical protein
MVAGASRLGEIAGPAPKKKLDLEEVPAFRMSSRKRYVASEILGVSSGTTSGVREICGPAYSLSAANRLR